MTTKFKIKVDDGSELLQDYAVEQNVSAAALYDWQRRAINYFFENKHLALYRVVTGGGKTFCAIEIIKRVFDIDPKIKVLIVVPKNVILETGWYKELYDNGFSLRDIGVFYGATKEYGKITITNMQNLENVGLNMFDFLVLDEIHNYATDRLLPIISKKFKYKIGLSATLERMDKKHYELLKIFDYNVFSYSPREALADEVLNPFTFYNISVEMDDENYDTYKTLTQELNVVMQAGGGFKRLMRGTNALKFRMLSLINQRNELVNNYPRKLDVVKMIVDKFRQDKFIIFNQFNKQTSKTYWYLLDINVKACVVHSGIPKSKIDENLIDFRNDKFNVLLASRVLDEGYNLPKIDSAIICAGNSTSRQTIQRMGRVLRRKTKPSKLYQIYCKGTIEEQYSLERSELFKTLCSGYNYYEYNVDDSVVNINE